MEALLHETSHFTQSEIDVALELFDEGVRPLSGHERDYETVGAFRGDQVVGYACFGPTPATDRTYDLYWIAVDPSIQGSGVGSALLQHAEQTIRERGARMLVIETSSREAYGRTRRFYERHGYAELARVRDFYAPGDDRVILAATLR